MVDTAVENIAWGHIEEVSICDDKDHCHSNLLCVGYPSRHDT